MHSTRISSSFHLVTNEYPPDYFSLTLAFSTKNNSYSHSLPIPLPLFCLSLPLNISPFYTLCLLLLLVSQAWSKFQLQFPGTQPCTGAWVRPWLLSQRPMVSIEMEQLLPGATPLPKQEQRRCGASQVLWNQHCQNRLKTPIVSFLQGA